MKTILPLVLFCGIEGAQQIQKPSMHFLGIPANILRINIISLLDLSSIVALSKVSSQCREYTAIQSLFYSRFNRNYFNSVPYDYIECTKLLGHIGMLLKKSSTSHKVITRKMQYFVQNKINKEKAEEKRKDNKNKINDLSDLFEFLWCYDQEIRNNDIRIASLGESFSYESKMQLYNRLYNPKCFNRTMGEEIQNALNNEYNKKLHCLFASKNVDLFTSLLYRLVKLYFFKPKKPIEYTILRLFVSKFINHEQYKQPLLIKLFQQSRDSIMCQLLEDQIINSEFIDEKNCNLLHYAAFYGFHNVVKMLVSSNTINVYAKNYWKKSPLDYVVYQKNREVRYLHDKQYLTFIEDQFERYREELSIARDEHTWFWEGAKMSKIFNMSTSIRYGTPGIR